MAVEELSDKLKEATKQHVDLQNLLSKTKTTLEESDKLYKLLKTPHEQLENALQTLSSETSNKLVSIERQLNNLTEKEEELDAIKKQALQTLSIATSAVLGKNYEDAQEKMVTKYYWIGFIISLTVLLAGYTYFLVLPFFNGQGDQIKWLNLAISTTSSVPLFWIAWYCQKSISQTKRIREEYNHKFRIMTMYSGFSQQIDKLEEGGELKKRLLSAMLNAIVKNPAETLGQPRTFLEPLKSQDELC